MNSSVNGLDTAFASRFIIWIEWALPFMEATYLLHNVLPRLSTLVVIAFQSCFSGGKFTFTFGRSTFPLISTTSRRYSVHSLSKDALNSSGQRHHWRFLKPHVDLFQGLIRFSEP